MSGYQQLLDIISAASQRILKDNLVGLYVHGSIAMGCFNWSKSDIDFIVVIRRSLTLQEKRTYMDFIMEINEQAPPKGIEMSVVLARYCRDFVYPTPYDLHFSNSHRERYRMDPDEYCRNFYGEDKDLAAHFTIIRHYGIVLCGNPIHDVFGEVPAAAYLDSIRSDVMDARNHIEENPAYFVLNLCRVAAYIRDSAVLSKQQGGVWGLEHLDNKHRDIIGKALRCYGTDENIAFAKDDTRRFFEDMLQLIFQ